MTSLVLNNLTLAFGKDTDFCKGEVTQKPKQQELSFLFTTHHINKINPVKFHQYIPKSSGIMASLLMMHHANNIHPHVKSYAV